MKFFRLEILSLNVEIIERLQQQDIKIIQNVKLSTFTHTKTGGNVPLMVFPKNKNELIFILSVVRDSELSITVLGSMTNVAVASGELRTIIINMTDFITEPVFDSKTNVLTVSAGYEMKRLSQWAMNHSITGLQWMEGIPGTVGAGAYMNAGFLAGHDFQSCMIDATVLMPDLTMQTISNSKMNFSYRRSVIQKNEGIVLSVRFLLRVGKKWKIYLKMAQYHRRRAKNQPLELPSAGTVFVPPTPYHVGGMLPKLGLVGYRIGGAQVSEKSPGFIVGVDHMTGEDYYDLVKFIQKQVMDNYGIELEPEVRLLGFKSINENK